MRNIQILCSILSLALLSGCSGKWHYEFNISENLEKVLMHGDVKEYEIEELQYDYDFADWKDEELLYKVQTVAQEESENAEDSTQEAETGDNYEEFVINNELKVCKGLLFNLNSKLASIYDPVGSTLVESNIFEDRSSRDSVVLKFRFNDDVTGIWAYARADGTFVSRPWESAAIPPEYYDIYPVVTGEISGPDYTGQYRQVILIDTKEDGSETRTILNDTYVNKKDENGIILMLHLCKTVQDADAIEGTIINEDLISRVIRQFQFIAEPDEELEEAVSKPEQEEMIDG